MNANKIVLSILGTEIIAMLVEKHFNNDTSGISTFLFVLFIAGTLLTWPLILLIERRIPHDSAKPSSLQIAKFKKNRKIAIAVFTGILLIYFIGMYITSF